MERYDAILEQLKQAQRRGMDTISNRLDSVVQNLDELIQEAKTSVQEALPQSASECLPIDEVEETLRAFHDEAQAERQRAADLEARIEGLEGGTDDAQQGTSVELLRSLDNAQSQSDLLKELLPAISSHVARAVVLVLRDGKVSAWSGIGFTDGERLRAWQGDAAESTALTTLVEHSRPVGFSPDEDDFFGVWLADEETPSDILLIPVALRGKLMGAVYVDRLEGHPWSPGPAQALVAQVCWLIDTLQFRPGAAPSLAEPTGIESSTEVAETEELPTEEARISDPHAVTAAIAPDVTYDEPEEEEFEDEEAPEEEAPPVPVEELEEEEEREPEEEASPVTAEESEEEEEEEEEEETESPEEEPEVSEIDPSATMKIDLSEMPTTVAPPMDEIDTEAVAEPESEIASESFEPDEPVEPETEPEISGESFEPDEPVEPEFETASQEFEEEPVEDEPVEAIETGTEAIPTEVQMPVPPPPEVEEEEPEPEDESIEEEKEPGSQASRFLDEPPPVKPVQPPPDEPEEEISEDEAQQEEARRFARLLVSEIKLYNEEQVERGRESRDLYSRLKEDIDRSREMFEKRISEEIREKQDFFQDEVVRILADGDPDLLGN